MNNKNTKNIFFMLLVLTLLVLTSTYSFANNGDINQEKTSFNSNMLKINKVTTNFLENSLFEKNSIKITNNNEKIISNEIYAEYNPSIVISGNDGLIAYETSEENKTKVYYKTSIDSFQNSSEARYVDTTFDGITYNATFPSFTKQTTNNEYFGAFLTPDNSSYIIELSGSGLNSIALWDYTNITSNGSYIGDFYDFKTHDVINYPSHVIPWVIGVIGKGKFIEEYDEFNCNNSTMFFYRDDTDPLNSRTIVFFPEVSNCSNISICLGENNVNVPMVYGVCEIKNNSSTDLLFFYGNPDIWESENLLRKNIIFSEENLTHPKIYANENNIYIVAETSMHGIVMYHSNNYGSDGSWVLKNVTQNILESGLKPVYPDLYLNNARTFCSFIESGNLIVTSSNNSGVNWTNPYKINTVNGSVVEDYSYKEMVNNHIFVWTDNRSGNFDIYFYVDYISKADLELLDINLESDLQPFHINNLLEITVKNNGDSIAKNIEMNVTFSFTDGEDTNAENIFEIAFLLPGETNSISRYLFDLKMPDFLYAFINFAGINSINVEVDPDGSTGDVDTSNNNLNKVFSYEDIFPIFGEYEEFFLLIKDILYP
jgi:hypothetical protein